MLKITTVRHHIVLNKTRLIAIAVCFAVACICTAATAGMPGKIMPLGDSITYGTVPGGYRGRLYSRLRLAGYDFSFVGSFEEAGNATPAMVAAGQIQHEGHPAICLDQIETNLEGNSNFKNGNGGYWFTGTGDREAVYPDTILLMAGINDFALEASVAQARDRLDSLLAHIFELRPTTTIIVASLTPLTGEPNTKWGQKVTEFNALVPDVVDNHVTAGRKAYFLDMYSKLTPADISGDGVHPNQSGYYKMGDAWFASIQAIPEPSTAGLLITGASALLAIKPKKKCGCRKWRRRHWLLLRRR